MFQVGDFIVYGNSGVCQVESVGPLDMDGVSKERTYYTLVQPYTSGGKIFTPVDNTNVMMRPIMTKKEANSLIGRLDDLETIWVANEKKREETYKDAVRACDCTELVRIIKTLYARKRARQSEGKKMTAADEKYFRIAEDKLYGELSISLGIERNKVKDYIFEHMEKKKK